MPHYQSQKIFRNPHNVAQPTMFGQIAGNNIGQQPYVQHTVK